MVKKDEVYKVEIIDMSSKGDGIAKINNFTIFIQNALVKDFCEIKITKLNKNYAFGKLLNIIKNSEYRVLPICPVFPKCGGCSLQHVDYDFELKIKQKKVLDALIKIGGFKEVIVSSVVSMENPYNYRNKVQFPVGEKDKEIQIGFYERSTHNIVSYRNCHIQNKLNETILNLIYEYMKLYDIKAYDESKNRGIVRHIFTRIGYETKEVMVCLIINGNKNSLKEINHLLQKLTQIPNIKSIMLNYNSKKTNVIMGEKTELLWGRNYILDYIRDTKFKISLESFYQINSIQTKKLYENILKIAKIKKEDIVVDAYCGIGTIALFLAKYCKQVYGIEIVESAIKNANDNAELNNIKNSKFILGKAENIIKNLVEENNFIFDIIIVDPPRKGCDILLLDSILKVKPKKVIYVSCNPSTLARDLKILCEKNYTIKEVIPFDFFPKTMSIETLVLLELN